MICNWLDIEQEECGLKGKSDYKIIDSLSGEE
jgi:hypothetical protein